MGERHRNGFQRTMEVDTHLEEKETSLLGSGLSTSF
jgi:hypothetical protein